MNEYPRMLYRAGGTEEIHGGRFATLIVHDDGELEAALAEGWSMSTPEAKAAAAKPAATTAGTTAAIPDDNAPPTRDEMKRKADELGLTYPGNISNASLATMIEAKLADQAKG
jgi:hypothetical protein